MKLQIVKDQADENTFQEWREEDYMNKMDFNPLVMFVVIPTNSASMLLDLYGRRNASKYSNICLKLNLLYQI